MKIKLAVIGCLLSLNVFTQNSPVTLKQAEAVMINVFTTLQDKNFDKLNSYFSHDLKLSLTAARLAKTSTQLNELYGKPDSLLKLVKKITAEKTYFEQGIQFEKDKADIVISINDSNQITSLRIAPYSSKEKWIFPTYASQTKFEEYPVKIGNESPLLGMFAKPNRVENLTIVVFVHGSGPNDMDETLGPNKLFKDLAYGLATNNIGSIRYNKRTYDYKSAMAKKANKLTIDEVVVNDAVIAIQKAKELGAKKIILVGHSLGGYMAPKIASKTNVDGIILMAGPHNPLEDIILPQLEHIMKYDSSTSINDMQYNQIKWQIENLKKGKYDSTTVGPILPLGLSGTFWISLKDYKPLKMAKKQDSPYLILNGGRDYQVTEAEAISWKNGNKNESSKTIIYPKLNHMFYAGEGILIPSEYEKQSNMDNAVLNDIIIWINSL